jgi:hypothetical protein
MPRAQLARLTIDRRRRCRRQLAVAEVIPSSRVFAREEREVWRELERRRGLRRARDLAWRLKAEIAS